jgi:diguanylate cyclase (GGDEF)-like protein/PAS domain S-box-containing protein
MIEDPGFLVRILDNLYDGVYFVDRQRRIGYWNRGAERLTGFASREVLGTCCSDNILMHVDETGKSLCRESCPLAETMEDGTPREAEVYLHHKLGHRVPVLVRTSPVRNAQGEIAGGVEIFSANAGQLAVRERMEELEKAVLLDPLTEAGNRRLAESVMRANLNALERYRWPFAVLFLDVDRFKEVNDRFGHDVGDQVLRMVATTLRNSVRLSDVVCRWGGEEFVVLLMNPHPGEAKTVAERIRALVESSSLSVERGRLTVTVSVGVAEARAGDAVNTLLRRADEALYRAKAAGRNQVYLAEEAGPL